MLKMKRSMAALLSVFVMGGALPAVQAAQPLPAVFAEESDFEELTEGSLTYRIYADHAEVASCDTEAEGEIAVPIRLNGLQVTAVGESAFAGCTKITSVTLPYYVASVGSMAFSGCTGLVSVSLPINLKSLGALAFFQCRSLRSIWITEGVTALGNAVFDGCESLEEVSVPASVESIGEFAFRNCKALKTITILDPECRIFYPAQTICNGISDETGPYFDGTIIGYEGSTAQKYAEENGYKFQSLGEAPLLGDVDGDGFVDAHDASMILLEYAHTLTGEDPTLEKASADVDLDGRINASDASDVLAYYAYVMSGGEGSLKEFVKNSH
ncbi:MAG: leucine-rich repeat protein [Ruminococcus sp.]|nr:leucine-rich repeat protein [Ruminococcus sp.]